MSAEREVAILCANNKSVYHEISGCVVYDKKRDARTFTGGMPIVAHPPCRAWSAFCAHQAKPEVGEKELGLLCCTRLVECGGVLEQPAHSRLWVAASFPKPSEPKRDDLFSVELWQAWFGYPTMKRTWLTISGVRAIDLPEIPFRLHARGRDKKLFKSMSHSQRSATPRAFAEWLVAVARLVNH